MSLDDLVARYQAAKARDQEIAKRRFTRRLRKVLSDEIIAACQISYGRPYLFKDEEPYALLTYQEELFLLTAHHGWYVEQVHRKSSPDDWWLRIRGTALRDRHVQQDLIAFLAKEAKR